MEAMEECVECKFARRKLRGQPRFPLRDCHCREVKVVSQVSCLVLCALIRPRVLRLVAWSLSLLPHRVILTFGIRGSGRLLLLVMRRALAGGRGTKSTGKRTRIVEAWKLRCMSRTDVTRPL